MTTLTSVLVDVATLSAGNWFRYGGELFMVVNVAPNFGVAGHTVFALPAATEGNWATGHVACIYDTDDEPAELISMGGA